MTVTGRSGERKKKFRKGMKVSSICEPTRVLVIDESTVPDGLFYEKGSNRW